MFPEGETVGATPDGRRAGEALSDNISPMRERMSMVPPLRSKSVSKVDHTRFIDGNISICVSTPSAFDGCLWCI